MFCIDDYNDSKVIVFAPTATFRVEHSTVVECEEGFDDCWSYSRECHYTKPNGCFSYEATTSIASVELMLENDVFVPVTLDAETTAKIKAAIEREAERQALEDEGDSEPDCFEYDEVA